MAELLQPTAWPKLLHIFETPPYGTASRPKRRSLSVKPSRGRNESPGTIRPQQFRHRRADTQLGASSVAQFGRHATQASRLRHSDCFRSDLRAFLGSGSLTVMFVVSWYMARAHVRLKINYARAFRQSLHLQAECISGEYKRDSPKSRYHWLNLA